MKCFILSSQRLSADTKGDAWVLGVGMYETASAVKGSTSTMCIADVMLKVDTQLYRTAKIRVLVSRNTRRRVRRMQWVSIV